MKHRPLAVLDIVGLTPDLIGDATPNLAKLASEGFMAPMQGVFPAVTCPAQSSMLTGRLPREHGIVANGWYFRDLAEVLFWRQANQLVLAEKVWEIARREHAGFTCSKLFWWYNMYSSADHSITLRPIYPADGRKIPALYSRPSDLHEQITSQIGPFPMFNFWGPAAGLQSSEWIARCAAEEFDLHRPSLQLVYLPHLDYNLQRLGPDDPRIQTDLMAIDRVAGELIEHLRAAGADILVVSEYGIENATGCVHINRVLRDAGYLAVRETLGFDLLDCGASRAFAVADHQVAHVYVRDPGNTRAVRKLLQQTEGIERVLDDAGKKELAVDHPRSGELIAIAEPGFWFTYYYWLDDSRAPDFARTVDIHRKPGYDPAELFIDPSLRLPALKMAWRLLQKKLGFRMLMDVIPLDANLVQGTHGRLPHDSDRGPLVIGTRRDLAADGFQMTDLRDLILRHWQ